MGDLSALEAMINKDMEAIMGETDKAVQDPAQVNTDPASAAKDGSTSKTTPKTYTEEEVTKRVSDSLAEQGRKHKTELEAVTKERDTFKGNSEQAQKKADEAQQALEDVEDTKAEIDDLKRLIEDNPDAASVASLRKELRGLEKQLKADYKAKEDALAELKKTLENERQQFGGEVAESRALRLAVDTFEVAEDYEGGDDKRLKSLCEDRIELTGKPMSRDDIDKLAAKLWTKKTVAKTGEEPEVETDSGVTKGGGPLTKAQIRDAFVADPNNMDKYRAYENSMRT